MSELSTPSALSRNMCHLVECNKLFEEVAIVLNKQSETLFFVTSKALYDRFRFLQHQFEVEDKVDASL